MKKKSVNIVVAVIILAALVAAAAFWYVGSNNHVASVAGEKITKAEYQFFLSLVKYDMESQANAIDEKARNDFWESTIEGENAKNVAKTRALDKAKELKIEVLKAKEGGISLTKDEKDNIKRYIDGIVENQGGEKAARKVIKEQLGISLDEYRAIYDNIALSDKFRSSERKNVQVTDEEVENTYKENPERFDEVTVKHVLFSTMDMTTRTPLPEEKIKEAETKANEILARVKAGEDIAALAKEYSEDEGSKEEGGEYTFNRYDQNKRMVPEFEEWAYNNAIGEAGLVETMYGYHVMKLENRVATPLDDVKNIIRNELLNAKFEKEYTEKMEAWKKEPKYNIEKNAKVFDSINVI